MNHRLKTRLMRHGPLSFKATGICSGMSKFCFVKGVCGSRSSTYPGLTGLHASGYTLFFEWKSLRVWEAIFHVLSEAKDVELESKSSTEVFSFAILVHMQCTITIVSLLFLVFQKHQIPKAWQERLVVVDTIWRDDMM